MKGKILDYSIQNSSGIISGNDGIRYKFQNEEWKSDKSPATNQIVDFEIEDNNAVGIYLDSEEASFNAEELKEKMTDFKNSDTVKNVKSNLNSALKDGVQNKFGFIISIIVAIALFLPVINIPFLGSVSLLNGGWGKLSFLGLLIIAGLFYYGSPKLFVKIGVGVISAIIFMQFYDLIVSLAQGSNMINSFNGRRSSNVNLFKLLEIGTYILIPLTLVLLYSGFKSEYVEKIK